MIPFPSDAVAHACDVTSWEQQLALFQFALSTYNQIDIVVPNAGVSDLGTLTAARATAVNGVPTKPNLKTIEINLIAVLYCAFNAFNIPNELTSSTSATRLALFYLLENSVAGSGALKAIVFVGSMC